MGKRSERLVRAAALRLAQELCDLLERPAVATVTKVLQGLVHNSILNFTNGHLVSSNLIQQQLLHHTAAAVII